MTFRMLRLAVFTISSAASMLTCMQVLMVEPVIAADRHTYEKSAIQIWLHQHDTSPVTGKALAHRRIVPNILIKGAIQTSQDL